MCRFRTYARTRDVIYDPNTYGRFPPGAYENMRLRYVLDIKEERETRTVRMSATKHFSLKKRGCKTH